MVPEPPVFTVPEEIEKAIDKVVENPAIFDAIRENPKILKALKEHEPFLHALANNPEILKTLQKDPKILDMLEKNPKLFDKLEQDPQLLKKLEDHPELLEKLKNSENMSEEEIDKLFKEAGLELETKKEEVSITNAPEANTGNTAESDSDLSLLEKIIAFIVKAILKSKGIDAPDGLVEAGVKSTVRGKTASASQTQTADKKTAPPKPGKASSKKDNDAPRAKVKEKESEAHETSSNFVDSALAILEKLFKGRPKPERKEEEKKDEDKKEEDEERDEQEVRDDYDQKATAHNDKTSGRGKTPALSPDDAPTPAAFKP